MLARLLDLHFEVFSVSLKVEFDAFVSHEKLVYEVNLQRPLANLTLLGKYPVARLWTSLSCHFCVDALLVQVQNTTLQKDIQIIMSL